jgi:hypothetical protein
MTVLSSGENVNNKQTMELLLQWRRIQDKILEMGED